MSSGEELVSNVELGKKIGKSDHDMTKFNACINAARSKCKKFGRAFESGGNSDFDLKYYV